MEKFLVRFSVHTRSNISVIANPNCSIVTGDSCRALYNQPEAWVASGVYLRLNARAGFLIDPFGMTQCNVCGSLKSQGKIFMTLVHTWREGGGRGRSVNLPDSLRILDIITKNTCCLLLRYLNSKQIVSITGGQVCMEKLFGGAIFYNCSKDHITWCFRLPWIIDQTPGCNALENTLDVVIFTALGISLWQI